MPSFRAQSRNPPCTLFFLAPFAEGFQFYFVTHKTLYRCARKIEGFARDDDTGIALSKHIRCTLREINPFPHTVISSAARNLPCTLFFLAPFTEGFPFSAVSHTALYRCARKIPRLRSGWRCGSGVFPTYPLYGTWVIYSPLPSFRAQREIFLALCSFLLLSQNGSPFPRFLVPFVEAFPFSAITHTTLYWCARKIEGFARDDVAWIPFPLTSHLLSL